MPFKAPRPCAWPGCPELTYGRFCPGHVRQYERERGSSTQRGYDRRWREIRDRILRERPICEDCAMDRATEVHHIIPKRYGGTDTPDNLMSLCKSCHSRRTIAGSRR